MLGWFHIPYLAFAIIIISLFVFCTRASVADTIIVASAMAVFVPADILVPMHFLRKWFGLGWAPDVFNDEHRLYWMISGLWAFDALAAAAKIALQIVL
jgi:hypothetical protein